MKTLVFIINHHYQNAGTAGWPSTTGNPSGGGRDNNPPKK